MPHSAANPQRPAEIAALNARFAGQGPVPLLQWAVEKFGDKLVVGASFGAEDVALIDLVFQNVKGASDIRFFVLDTGRLPQETYNVIDAVRARYPIRLEIGFPEATAVAELTEAHGPNLFYDSVELRKACCGVRKVRPLQKILRTADAWVTGLRRSQNVTRADITPVEIDTANGGLLKLNPLIEWSTDDVWTYIRAHNVPYNTLHDRGYPSIGCAPCTRAVAAGEDERAGRWWWENPDSKECGLHAHATAPKSPA